MQLITDPTPGTATRRHRARRGRLLAGALALTLAGGTSTAAAATGAAGSPATPSQCIRLNGGDYNACNVGNSGRGDLPYRSNPHWTPNDCIRLNGGDYNACNVGNSGRGDLPYRPVH